MNLALILLAICLVVLLAIYVINKIAPGDGP